MMITLARLPCYCDCLPCFFLAAHQQVSDYRANPTMRDIAFMVAVLTVFQVSQ